MTPSAAPRFSVVVPFLNEARWLPETLAALDLQEHPASDFELLFVDNGSSDGSTALVRGHRWATVLQESRRDPYIARNRGIEAARGEYVVLLDADCPPATDWLAAYSRAIDNGPADILVGALLHPMHSPLMLRCYEDYYNRKVVWLLSHGRRRNYFGHAGNMVIRRSVFERIGLFDAMPVVGDTEIIHRLLARVPDAVVRSVPDAHVVHAEVDSVRMACAKLMEIGGHTQSLVAVAAYRPVGLGDKLRIAADTLRHNRHGWIGPLALLAMLAAGWAAYACGRVRRRLSGPAVHRHG